MTTHDVDPAKLHYSLFCDHNDTELLQAILYFS